jgi:hypothetical protein
MECMKRLAVLLCGSAALGFGADLAVVKNVYLLKMSKGLDQYLANRITNERLFQIVTDPKLADAIFTDQIGEGFEAKMNELFPPPEPEEKEEAPQKPEKGAKADANNPPDAQLPFFGDTVNKLASPASMGSFGRAKGTVFLVDAKSKQVVWSTYDLPKDATSRQMDRTANDIVSRLKRQLKQK